MGTQRRFEPYRGLAARDPGGGQARRSRGELRPHPISLPQERGLPLQPKDHRLASSSFLHCPSTEGRRRQRPTTVTGRGTSAALGPRDSTAAPISPSPGGDFGSAQRRGEGGTFAPLARPVAPFLFPVHSLW